MRMEGPKIVALGVGASVLYGILHDLVTVRICLEYFTVFHPRVLETEDPTLLAVFWGVMATWWGGLLIGVPLAVAARAGRASPVATASLVRPVLALLAAMAAVAALAGVVGRTLATRGVLHVPPQWGERIPRPEHVDFLTDLWVHNGSYAAGFVGGILLVVRTWRGRRRPTAGEATDPVCSR